VLAVISRDDFHDPPSSTPQLSSANSAMIELTLTLSDEQVARIAERAAAFLPTETHAASPWVNVVEAAEHLRCSRDRIYDLIALGRLHPRRDGRRVLLNRHELDAYVEGIDR
jgi:excisionase family DNA binding protein